MNRNSGNKPKRQEKFIATNKNTKQLPAVRIKKIKKQKHRPKQAIPKDDIPTARVC